MEKGANVRNCGTNAKSGRYTPKLENLLVKKMDVIWNPWHGCRKISEGCLHCYMFRRDAQIGKDSTIVTRTAAFDLPLQKRRDGSFRLQTDGTVYVCMTSDFFLEQADEWRQAAWECMRRRTDLRFTIVTKRIARFTETAPPDWGDGWPHVTICCTCENQKRADERLPVLLELPLQRRAVIHEPMLGEINISPYLATGKIDRVICGGESGAGARVCHYDWIVHSAAQCRRYGVPFVFKQTGARFCKDGRVYTIPRPEQHTQAKKALPDLERRIQNFAAAGFDF